MDKLLSLILALDSTWLAYEAFAHDAFFGGIIACILSIYCWVYVAIPKEPDAD